MAENISMRERLKRIKASKAGTKETPVAEDTSRNTIATDSMVATLKGDKPDAKARLKLKLRSKKSVVNKCHDKEAKTVEKSKAKSEQVKKPDKVEPSVPVIAPVIFIQDNLLRAAKHVDLNALRLDTTNNDNSIDFDGSACRKLFDKGIKFYVEASENPMPEILDEVQTGFCVKRYLPKGHEPFLQAMFITGKGKAVFEYAITFSQIVKIVERGASRLSQVCGNLTAQQIGELKLILIEGECFSYYVRKASKPRP